MDPRIGPKAMLGKAGQFVPFLLLMGLNIVWTCNLGPRFLYQPANEELAEELAEDERLPMPSPSYICLENARITVAMCLQLAAFTAILLLLMAGIIAEGPFDVRFGQKLLRKIEMWTILALLLLAALALGFYLWYATSIRADDGQLLVPMAHTHFTSLTLLALQAIYAMLLLILLLYRAY